MIFIWLVIVFIQLKGYEQHPSSFPINNDRSRYGSMQPYEMPYSKQNSACNGNENQNAIGTMQQVTLYKYEVTRNNCKPLPISHGGKPQQAISRFKDNYLQRSQSIGQAGTVKSYQPVYRGEALKSNCYRGSKSQLNTQIIPQFIREKAQSDQISRPFQNEYQVAPNRDGKTPSRQISTSHIQNDYRLSLPLPRDFREQNTPLSYTQTAPKNTYQLPHRNRPPTESLSNLPSYCDPSDGNNSPEKINVPHFPKNIPQNFPTNTLRCDAQGVRQYVSREVPQYSPYPNLDRTRGQLMSQAIQPYHNQCDSPQNRDYSLKYPQPYNSQQNRRTNQYFEGEDTTVPTQRYGGNFASAQEFNETKSGIYPQLEPNSRGPSGDGYLVINDPQSQQQSGQINEEGYQVINEGPVPHFLSVGKPSTEIITHSR